VFRPVPHSNWTRILRARRCHLRAEDDRSAGAPFLALPRRPLRLCRAGTGAARSASHAEREGVEPHPMLGLAPGRRTALTVPRSHRREQSRRLRGSSGKSRRRRRARRRRSAQHPRRRHVDSGRNHPAVPRRSGFGERRRLHLAKDVGWALTGSPVDDDGMLELLEPWRGHRQRIVRLIGASGFRKPRFGPRITIQDHRVH
jgi:hypothetical protein